MHLWNRFEQLLPFRLCFSYMTFGKYFGFRLLATPAKIKNLLSTSSSFF
jgi:hypothetical protein